MTEDKNEKLEDELAKIKAEMSEIKEMLKNKSEDPDYELEYETDDSHGRRGPRGPRAPRGPRWTFDFNDDVDVDFDDLGETINIHLGNVMSGLEENLERSFAGISKGFGFKMHKKAEKAQRKAEKEMHRAEREMHKAERKFRRREEREARKFKPLTAEELEAFLELGANLAGSLSDSRRLMILKELEEKPHYPAELSEKLNFKGGTLKHHLDNLVTIKFLSQEAVRGRYLITQLGMEALKMTEMLFRRHQYMVKKEEAPEEEVEIRDEEEVEIDVETENEEEEN